MDYLKKILLHKKNNQPQVSNGKKNGDKKIISNLNQDGLNIIGEIKTAVPSKGQISYGLNKAEAAKQYGRHSKFIKGVAVVTEPLYFGGSSQDLKATRKSCQLPLLRKDFILYPSQIYESIQLGADSIWLIASLLGASRLKRLHALAVDLGLEVMIEVRNPWELEKAQDAGASLICINNRNIKTLKQDDQNTLALASQAKNYGNLVFISENNISSLDDIVTLYQEGIKNILVGTYFMRAKSLEVTLNYMEHALKKKNLI